ncbi:hypothetical protein WN944_017099 [Citrus x changshan-huyou]|uniref:Uncharacterized protein n=1 Tax=Citrus x changshan-huyou TaxID=2935761 RepID=A0AAP0QP81_9ROSI
MNDGVMIQIHVTMPITYKSFIRIEKTQAIFKHHYKPPRLRIIRNSTVHDSKETPLEARYIALKSKAIYLANFTGTRSKRKMIQADPF